MNRIRQDKRIKLVDKLKEFSSANLDDFNAASQLHRFDRKFLFREELLFKLLCIMNQDYSVLSFSGKPVQQIQTRYYDTPNLDTYISHHNGKGRRFKIRSRKYLSTKRKFLEIKEKTPKGLTLKHRKEISNQNKDPLQFSDFIETHSPYCSHKLKNSLITEFSRISMLSMDSSYRITLDLDIKLIWKEFSKPFPSLVVAEIKKQNLHFSSEFEQGLKKFGIRNRNFSKYCTGISLLADPSKTNRFKENKLYIEKILKENPNVDHNK